MNLMQCSLLLSSNFYADPLFEYAFRGTPAQRNRALEAYFSAALDACLATGELVLAPGNVGLAGWIPGTAFPPHIDDNRISNQPSYVAEGWSRFNMHEITPESIIQTNAQEFAYLWLLAVDFSARGRGVAGQLLETSLDQMKEGGFRECWLSTENPANRAFYEKYGFTLFQEALAESGLRSLVFRKLL